MRQFKNLVVIQRRQLVDKLKKEQEDQFAKVLATCKGDERLAREVLKGQARARQFHLNTSKESDDE